jgi:hypothetical protein
VQDFIIIIYHCAAQDFLTQSSGLSPEERARVLEADDDICRGHDDAAQEGQTAAPPRDESIDYHFIAFVQVTQRCQLAENSAVLNTRDPKLTYGRNISRMSWKRTIFCFMLTDIVEVQVFKKALHVVRINQKGPK